MMQGKGNGEAFILETERLIIRPYQKADLEPLYTYRNDPEVARYQGWDLPYARERAINWINNSGDVVPTKPGGRFSAALELRANFLRPSQPLYPQSHQWMQKGGFFRAELQHLNLNML